MLDLAIVVAVLLIQPLVALLYVYVAYRAMASFTARKTGEWADDRIDKAKEAADDLR